MEAIIIALIEYVGVPLIMKLIASKTPKDVAEAELQAAYKATRLLADEAAEAIIDAP